MDNPAFTYGGENPQKFDERFFGINNFTTHRYTCSLGNLKLAQFLDPNNTCVDQETVEQLLGFHITNKKYDNIRRCFNTISANIVRPFALAHASNSKLSATDLKREASRIGKFLRIRYLMKFPGILSRTRKTHKQLLVWKWADS